MTTEYKNSNYTAQDSILACALLKNNNKTKNILLKKHKNLK